MCGKYWRAFSIESRNELSTPGMFGSVWSSLMWFRAECPSQDSMRISLKYLLKPFGTGQMVQWVRELAMQTYSNIQLLCKNPAWSCVYL